MSDLRNVGTLLADAERAAGAGDLVSAEELLNGVARLQEAELGPSHPDLANTYNNLAVVVEQAGREQEAERFYRKAVAIASAALPPDDPMVAACRQNLEDFCRAHGLSIDAPVVEVPPVEAPAVVAVPPPVDVAPPVKAPPPVEASPPVKVPPLVEARAAVEATRPPSVPQPTAVRTPLPPPRSAPEATQVAREPSRVPMLLVVAVVALLAVALLIARPWSRRAPTAPPRAAPAPSSAPAAEAPRAEPPAAEPRRAEPPRAEPPRAEPPRAAPAAPARAPAPARAAGDIAVVTAQLCRGFSASDLRCDPAGDSARPGPIVFLTRIRSPREGVVVHRWFRGDSLRKSARLRIGANAVEGYRTYSRQTVDRGEWRVEVRSADGNLLDERRLTVR